MWVSTTLYRRGCLSTKKLWSEYEKDPNVVPGTLKSLSHLKNSIIPLMVSQNKLTRGQAIDRPEFKRAGWQVVPKSAFKNVDPEILSKLDPLPELDRTDYKEYLQMHGLKIDV